MTKNLRILLVGEAKASGRLQSFARAFTQLGHDVGILDLESYWKIGRINRFLNHLLPVPFYFNTSGFNHRVLSMASYHHPQFILFFKPVLISPRTLLSLREKRIRVYSWYPDDIFYRANASAFFYQSIPLFDCHFTTKTHNLEELRRARAREVIFLPHAVDTTYHFPMIPSPQEKAELGADVVFVGTWANDNRYHFLERLAKEGVNLKIYGNHWNKVPKSSPLHGIGAIQQQDVYGSSLSLVLNSSHIALAFLRAHNRDQQTARTYEIPACGTFMLHERTDEAKRIYKEAEEADFFSDYTELKTKIDFYLTHPRQRETIAKQGYQRAIQPDVSYTSRATEILSLEERLTCAA